MKQIVAIALGPLLLSGCVSFGGKAPPTLLTVTASEQRPANSERSTLSAGAITVSLPIVPQALANTRVAVADGGTSIAYIKDAFWAEPPARLFQRVVSETIAAKTGKVVLDPRQFSLDPGIILSGQLTQFGIDASRNEAVIVYDAAISRNKGQQVMTRRFEARQPVSEIKPLPASNALNAAANRIAGDIAAWIG
jgi:cholesterol transport system auxiliary component